MTPMHITILTFGSRGDVQPFVALGVGLKQAGHAVKLVTYGRFADLAQAQGLDFHPVAGDIHAILQSDRGRDMLESGQNPISIALNSFKEMKPLIMDMFRDCWAGCQGSDLLVLGGPGYFAGTSIAEKLGIPQVEAYVQPLTPTKGFPSPMMPALPWHWGWYNKMSHYFGGQVFWQAMRPAINQVRRQQLGLKPYPLGGPFWKLYGQNPVLYGFSPRLIPHQPDWGDFTHVTGYWFLERPDHWEPSRELMAFLEAGPPPVYVGFGSMNNRDPQATTKLVLDALAAANQRGILLSGWGGLDRANLPETVFMVDDVPHDWLFPRMSAIVHHGGAGTTAAALRSGIPSLIIPFFADQPFWAEHVYQLGASPLPIPRAKLTAERLAAALQQIQTDKRMWHEAGAVGQTIREEDGIGQAVAVIEAYAREKTAG